MFLSITATAASCAASFSRAARQASDAPSRARVTSAFSSGKRTRRALMPAICVSRSSGGGTCACSSESFFNRSRSAASFSCNRRSTLASSRSQRSAADFRLVLSLEDRLLFLLEFGQGRVLFLRVVLPLQLDLADSFLDRGDPQRDFLLFLLEFLERDDLVAHLRKVHRLRATFPSQVDLALLQDAFLVPQRDPRFLPANLQPDLAQPCSNETHGVRLHYSSLLSFARTPKSSSVVVSPVTVFPLATSFSKRRMILPLRVFGNASANRISSGLAIAPM